MISTWTKTRRRVAGLALAGVLVSLLGGALTLGAVIHPGVNAQQRIDVFWVAQQGNDANPGTTAQAPLRTVERAMALAGPGDSILVGAGTWPRLSVKNVHGTLAQPITIRSAPGSENRVWFSHGRLDSEFGIMVSDSSFVILDDLNAMNSMWGVRIVRSTGIVYRNGEVRDIGQEAVGVSERSAHVLIEGNLIHRTGRLRPTWGEGVYVGTGKDWLQDTVRDVVIRNNEIAWTTAEAIDVKPWAYNVLIEGNRIHDINTANSGAVVVGIGKVSYPDPNVVIRLNRIWNVTRTSQWSDGNAIALSAPATVHDNVLYNVQHRGIIVDANFVNPNARRVRIYNNTITNWGLKAIEVWTSPNPSITESWGNTLGGPIPPAHLPVPPPAATSPTPAPPVGEAAGTVAPELIAATYRDFLKRAAGEQEINYWAARLRTDLTMTRYLRMLVTSDEWLGTTVDALYKDTLGRSGDGSGRSFWINRLRTVSVPVVAAQFYGSAEYVGRFPDGRAWAGQLYQQLLGRQAGGAELDYWAGRLSQRTHPAVALEIFQTPESRSRRVADLYRVLLGREPDPGGLQFWSERILRSGDLLLAVDLASSPEYRTRNGG
jgi:hypothetical protein